MVETTEEHNTQPAFEIAAFEAAYEAVETARKQTDVLAADIYRHLTSLRAGDNVCRTSEMQAMLSIEDTVLVIHDVLKSQDALMTIRTGEAEAQANNEKAKRVIEILDKMEADGEFETETEAAD